MAAHLTTSTTQHAILQLITDYTAMNGTHYQTIDRVPTPLEFSRIVQIGRPVLIKNYASQTDLPAYRKWNGAYLTSTLGQDKLTISVTPSGNADSLVEVDGKLHFVEPHQEAMTMSQVLTALKLQVDEPSSERPIIYLQSQNGNLHDPYHGSSEFARIRCDVPAGIPFADEALDKQPDAVNIWIGGSASTTSLHKDPYENIYVVIRGAKTFTLLPPTEGALLDTKRYPHAAYSRDTPESELKIVPKNPSTLIPWTSIDPTVPMSCQPTLYAQHARPLTIRVEAGDAMFLPSGWWHHVRQLESADDGGPCIALNWWYDSEYRGERWAMRAMMDRMARSVGWLDDGHVDEDEGEDSDEHGLLI